ncbi:MAG TPA: FAD:protein FMN transferase [Anaerolineaceae bacterium]|jgi:thiamine biosynthesis lipoprotein
MSLKETRILMGMPVTLEVVDAQATPQILSSIFAYFEYVDEKFSTYKETSEISLINQRAISLEEASHDMRTVFKLADELKLNTHGYFDILHEGAYDPSGLVKGWAISNAAEMLRQRGFENYTVEAGGDFQAVGKNSQGQNWRVGIRSPFNLREIVKVLSISDRGVATSGSYIRGQHVYNPKEPGLPLTEIVSLTVIGPDVYDADCLATAAFAMGTEGIYFIENQDGFEGYMIDQHQLATYTTGFERYVIHD